MKVCIVGAGAIGGVFGGWLGRSLPPAELALSVLARGETLTALQRDGLHLESADGAKAAVRVRAESDAQRLGPQDLVVLAVKAPSLASVAALAAPLLAPHTQVLVAMNGVPWWFFDHLPGECQGLRLASVDPGDAVRAAIPTRHVIGCVVHLSSTVPAPGRIRHGMGNGLIIGEPAGGDSERLASLAALLTRAGFAVTVSPLIQRDIWFKLWGNMTVNPISALTGATADRILDDPLTRAVCSAVMLEAQAIGARFGCAIDQTPEQRHAVTRKLGAFKTSMLQDLEAGRPLELDALVGAVREIGQHLAIPTPHIDSLLGLTRLMGRSRGLYPA